MRRGANVRRIEVGERIYYVDPLCARGITDADLMPTLYTMTLDTEEEWAGEANFPVRHYTLDNIQALPRFEDACSRHGVRPTCFTNWAVLNDPRSRDVILALHEKPGVEIAMHVHPWNTPPIVDEDPPGRDTFLANLPDDQVLAKLESTWRIFKSCGITPRTFRGGRYSTGSVAQTFLRDKRFLADASVVPWTHFPVDGSPDFRDRGLLPVRLPPRHEGDAAMWEIPLTRGFTRRDMEGWARRYRAIEYSWLSKFRLIGLMEKFNLVRRVWLNFDHTPASEMLPMLEVLRGMDLPCICFTAHSSSLMRGKNPYVVTAADEERMWSSIDRVFSTLSGWQEFRPATVSQVAEELEAQHDASSWNQPTGQGRDRLVSRGRTDPAGVR